MAAGASKMRQALDGDEQTGLPAIALRDGDLKAHAHAAWLHLGAANKPPRLFTFGGALVRVTTDERGDSVPQTLCVDALRGEIAGVVAFFKPDKTGNERRVYPPPDVMRNMLTADLGAMKERPVPILARVVAAPTFAADGALNTTPGYCPASRTFLATACPIPPVPVAPTADDIATAKTWLSELLFDFPLDGAASRAHAWALLLLPFVRALVSGPTPLHLIEKPTAGTGAGLLTDVLTLPALGKRPDVMTESGDSEAWKKAITATLIGAPAVVLIDNLKRRLDSADLAAALTASTWKDRLLGVSQMLRLPIECVWIATGNNPQLSHEMARRTISIRLDAKCDQPWMRPAESFRYPKLYEWATEHRPELIWSALTLGSAWIAEGRPKGSQTLGAYEEWSRVLGGILDVAGVPGFLANTEKLYATADAEGSVWRTLVGVWWDAHGDAEVGVSDLWKLITAPDSDIGLDLGRGDETSKRTKLGLLLKSKRAVQFGEYRIVAGGLKRRAQQWRLEQCTG